METVGIKKSKTLLYIFIAAFACGLYFFVHYSFDWISSGSNTFSKIFFCFIVLLLLAPIIYWITELIKNKNEIELSEEGIKLRGKGLYKWQEIDEIRILSERTREGDSLFYLLLKLAPKGEIKFLISHLDHKISDIAQKIMAYSGRTDSL